MARTKCVWCGWLVGAGAERCPRCKIKEPANRTRHQRTTQLRRAADAARRQREARVGAEVERRWHAYGDRSCLGEHVICPTCAYSAPLRDAIGRPCPECDEARFATCTEAGCRGPGRRLDRVDGRWTLSCGEHGFEPNLDLGADAALAAAERALANQAVVQCEGCGHLARGAELEASVEGVDAAHRIVFRHAKPAECAAFEALRERERESRREIESRVHAAERRAAQARDDVKRRRAWRAANGRCLDCGTRLGPFKADGQCRRCAGITTRGLQFITRGFRRPPPVRDAADADESKTS